MKKESIPDSRGRQCDSYEKRRRFHIRLRWTMILATVIIFAACLWIRNYRIEEQIRLEMQKSELEMNRFSTPQTGSGACYEVDWNRFRRDEIEREAAIRRQESDASASKCGRHNRFEHFDYDDYEVPEDFDDWADYDDIEDFLEDNDEDELE